MSNCQSAGVWRAHVAAMAAFGLALAATTFSAHAVPVERRGYFQGDIAEMPCSVRIDFTNGASGPDIETFDAVRAYIANSKDIQYAEAYNFGTKGEFTICLQIEDPEGLKRAFDDLTRIVPKAQVGPGGAVVLSLGKPSN